MSDTNCNAIEIRDLRRKFGKANAVDGLSLTVRPGRCYGLFGRNGAGKTTTIKCLLNHLRPTGGKLSVFGHSPQRHEVAVKSCIGYVPEQVAFYPWMTTRGVIEYAASFRKHWNREIEADLLRRFEMDESKKVKALSKGMKAQLALVCAICPEPDLLLLDEPTSGLDPIVRRDFIQTVIGAYQEGAPEKRTIFVSTHLIHEFEGLIDEFTIIDKGKELLTLEADTARERFKKIRLRFAGAPPEFEDENLVESSRESRQVEYLATDYSDDLAEKLRALSPEAMEVENLTLEEIFIAVGKQKGAAL